MSFREEERMGLGRQRETRGRGRGDPERKEVDPRGVLQARGDPTYDREGCHVPMGR